MQKREGRSFAPPPIPPSRPDLGRTGRRGAPHTGLPVPTPLPSLTAALSRRAALFGAVTVAGCTAAALPGSARTGVLSANDARLVAIAAEVLDIDTRANALEVDTPEYDALIDRYTPLEEEMADTAADSLLGVMAKVRTSRIPAVAGCVNGIDDSIFDDLLRLHAAGVVS